MPRTIGTNRHGVQALLWALAAASPEGQDVRRRVLEAVARFPGLHLREIAREVDVSASHAEYHLHALAKARLVSRTEEEAYVRFWPTKATPVGNVPLLSEEERRMLRWLRRPAVLEILVRLAVDAPRTLTDLSRACGLAPSTGHHHLGRLADAGLVVQDEDRAWHLADRELVLRLLREYEPPPRAVAGFLATWQRLAP